jgi:hypothetical protein
MCRTRTFRLRAGKPVGRGLFITGISADHGPRCPRPHPRAVRCALTCRKSGCRPLIRPRSAYEPGKRSTVAFAQLRRLDRSPLAAEPDLGSTFAQHFECHSSDTHRPPSYSVLCSKELPDLGAPLRNRTVDLLLTIPTTARPGRTACAERTPERTESTESTGCSSRPVHDSFHEQ